MELIELYITPSEFKKRITYILKDVIVGTLKLTYAHLNQLMGPTFAPRIIGNSVLLSYPDDGISFVFKYSEKEFKDGSQELTQD